MEPGVRLRLDPEDVIHRLLLLDGNWEPQVWQGIASHLREGCVFVDVGAHIGYYTLKAAQMVRATGRVLAFEPNPSTRDLLAANVGASRAGNVTILPYACCDRDCELQLIDGPASHTGSASLARENAERFSGSTGASCAVLGKKLDDIVAELALSRLDVLKIDVEGAEPLVFQGAARTLAVLRPVVIVEIIPENLSAMNFRVDDLTAHLRAAGYDAGRPLGESDWEFRPLAI
jgi:FkbM family methyltransferase